MNITRPLLFLATVSLTLTSGHAALIWEADFSSYDTSGGAVNVTVNNTGDDDTLSGTTTSSANLSLSAQVVSASSPLTGNALRLITTNTGASSISGSVATIFQGLQPSLESNGIYILSTDMVKTSSNSPSGARSWSATGATSTTGNNNTASVTMGSTVWRFTLVINQTGNDITLPGTLGTLANNSVASYFYSGTTFDGLTITTVSDSSAITGFSTGYYRSNSLSAGGNVTIWYDNMGLWDSSSDTIDGTSVLSLAPGTVVPEPSTYALGFIGLIALGLVIRRRRLSASSSLL